MASEAELSKPHRYAAGGLFALALAQSQLHQSTQGFGDPRVVVDPPPTEQGNGEPQTGLLRPVFRYLGIEEKEWAGLESNSVSGEAPHHISSFLKLLLEEDEASQKLAEDQDSLSKAVDAAVESAKQKQESTTPNPNAREPRDHPSHDSLHGLKEAHAIPKARKVAVLYTLLAACVSDDEVDADSENPEGFGATVKTGYDARHRVSLRLLALWLDVSWAAVSAMELMVAFMAMAVEKEMEKQEGKDGKKKESRRKKWKRGGMIGAAAVTGGALLFVTGGLAAPAIAAGLQAVAVAVPVLGAGGLTAAAAVAGSGAVGSAAVAASFGAAGARMTGKKMARRTGDIEEFEFVQLGSNHQQGRLAVEIVVSGIAFEPDDFVKPWEALDGDLERYALRWESEVVFTASTAIQDTLKTIWLFVAAMQQAIKQGAMYTVLGGLVTAMASPLLVLGATNVIDSKWGMALDRSEKAGKLLATILLEGRQGNRPVTLTGFALGARIIFICLEELARHGEEAS